jgi:hypothetical protein
VWVFLHTKASRVSVSTATWPRYGGVGRRRAAAVGPMAALGRRDVASAQAPRGSAGDPQTSRTGVNERGARIVGHGPASACVYGRYSDMPTRPGASSAATSRGQRSAYFPFRRSTL